jgi:hypothetical protein
MCTDSFFPSGACSDEAAQSHSSDIQAESTNYQYIGMAWQSNRILGPSPFDAKLYQGGTCFFQLRTAFWQTLKNAGAFIFCLGVYWYSHAAEIQINCSNLAKWRGHHESYKT